MINWTANYTTASEQLQNRTHGVDTLNKHIHDAHFTSMDFNGKKGGDVKRIVLIHNRKKIMIVMNIAEIMFNYR